MQKKEIQTINFINETIGDILENFKNLLEEYYSIATPVEEMLITLRIANGMLNTITKSITNINKIINLYYKNPNLPRCKDDLLFVKKSIMINKKSVDKFMKHRKKCSVVVNVMIKAVAQCNTTKRNKHDTPQKTFLR